jgi:hypothetical protein
MTPSDQKPPTLSARDRQIASLLAVGKSHREAAAELKLGIATVGRTAAKPGFKQLVRELRLEAADVIFGAVLDAALAAVAELRRVMTQGTSRDGPRVTAARALLAFMVDAQVAGDLRAQIDEVKATLAQRDEPKLPPAAEPEVVAAVKPATDPELGADFDAALNRGGRGVQSPADRL